VAAIGARLAACSPRRGVDYRFQIVELEEPNAFALPGGSVFVSRGLVALANDEAELANVLAHEIGHVAARHAAQRHAHQSTLGLATLLGTLATGRGQEGKEDTLTGGVFAYSRNQEREADEIGQEIARCAGVDPDGMGRFLRTLDRSTRLTTGYSPEQHYLSSHPATPERIAEVSTRSEVDRLAGESRAGAPQPGAAGASNLPFARTRAEYLRRIEGMTLNRPAAEGVFVENLFVHPELGFALRFPHGWTLQNLNAAVVGISPRGDVIALLELQGEGDDPEAAAREFAKEAEARWRDGVPVRIGTLAGFRAEAIALETQFGPVSGEVTWIAHGGRIYRLVAGVEAGRVAPAGGALRGFARSFRPLDAGEIARLSELRLRVALARDGESLVSLGARTRNEWDPLRTAVANAMQVDRPLREGELVKVAVREPYRRSAGNAGPEGSERGGP
jgi:predicted Zn-dependent protease